MERIFYKIPTTIGEELEAQIKYCKSIRRIKNNSDLSLKMRELEKEVFGNERNYRTMEEREYNIPKDRKIPNIRAGTITDLSKITLNEKIPNYLLLFSAFKILNIIQEDENIIKLLNYYELQPKKKTEQDRLNNMQRDNEQHYLSMCCECKRCINSKCENKTNCLFLKLKNMVEENREIDEKMKLLYKLGFSSNWIDILLFDNSTHYNISVETLKNILEYMKMTVELKYVKSEEEKYETIFIKMVQDSRNDWENEMEKQKEKIKELEDTKDLKGLQELKKSNKILEVNREFLNESRGNKFKKRRPYYLDNIEDICYMKSKFPQTTIH